MAKFKSDKNLTISNDVYRLRFRIPVAIKKDMGVRVMEDGYGFRGKSKWISDAIVELFDDPSWKEQVLTGDYGSTDKTKEDTVVLENDMNNTVNRMAKELILEGLLQQPSIIVDGYLGAIVRTAIAKKLYMKGQSIDFNLCIDEESQGKSEWERFEEFKKDYLKRNGVEI